MFKIEEFEKWLESRQNVEQLIGSNKYRKIDFGLDNVRSLCNDLGNPERSCPTVHVAGSKGKGSVSRMIASILQASLSRPKKVGVFASPHVKDLRERFSAADGFFTDEVYAAALEEFLEKAEQKKHKNVSWFELVFAYAAECFKCARTDYAVYEVGLGGRLDATNILQPEICCVTLIELEHTELLGDTLEKIAGEKAGIIKPGVPVVVAAQEKDSVRKVFRDKAELLGVPIYFVDELAKVQVGEFRLDSSGRWRMTTKIESELFVRPLEIEMQMLGLAQARNAAQAAVTVKLMLPEISEDEIEKGLAAAVLPGRFEVRKNIFDEKQPLILDAAHTPCSMNQTLETLDAVFGKKKMNLLFGAASGKDLAHMVPMFAGRFNKIFVTKPGDFKKSDLAEMVRAFEENGMEVLADEDFAQMSRRAMEESADDKAGLLATGSFYLLDEVEKALY